MFLKCHISRSLISIVFWRKKCPMFHTEYCLHISTSIYCNIANDSCRFFCFAFYVQFTNSNIFICSSLIRSFRSNQMSDCERFAQIAQDKWATMSESLRSLRGNERPWAKHSGCSRQMSDRERFAQVAQDKWANDRFAPKILAKRIKILFFSMFCIGFFFFNEQFALSLFFGE